MSDAAIQHALDEAEMRSAHDDRQECAAVVAAFLRALPDFAVEIGGDRPLYSLHMLAAEVEAAARG